MNTVETDTGQDTAIETRPEISEEAKKKLLAQVAEEGQVIVHCRISAPLSMFSMVARIWPTTFLICKASGYKSRLIHLEGITSYPSWTEIPAGRTLYFTLIFSPLPKPCKVFDFIEAIPEEGGFKVKGIKRNRLDVYHVDLTG